MNLIDGVLADGTFRSETLRLAVEYGKATGAVTLGVRPDDLVLTPAEDGSTRVMLIELLGPRAIVTLDAGGEHLTSVVEAAALSELSIGGLVDLSIRRGGAHFFDADSGERLTGS